VEENRMGEPAQKRSGQNGDCRAEVNPGSNSQILA